MITYQLWVRIREAHHASTFPHNPTGVFCWLANCKIEHFGSLISTELLIVLFARLNGQKLRRNENLTLVRPDVYARHLGIVDWNIVLCKPGQ